MELEELLNKLIKRGWKPFGFRGEETWIEMERDKDLDIQIFKLNWIIIEQHHRISGSLRNLVSKESGLWQFCMSEGFTPNVSCYRWEKWLYDIDDLNQCEADVSGFDNYGYRLIESALKSESELEEFLLDNIKV